MAGLASAALVLGGGVLTALPAHAAAALYVSADGVTGPSKGCGASAGTTTYTTIGSAVAAAGSGDTIYVCAGTYDENVQTSTSLTFVGAQAGQHTFPRSGPESVVDGQGQPAFSLGGSDSQINGFTLTGSTTTASPAVSLTGDGSQLDSDVFDSNVGSVLAQADDVVVSNGYFTNPGTDAYGLQAASGSGAGDMFTSNTIEGSTWDQGVVDINNGTTTPLTGIVIDSNYANLYGGTFASVTGTSGLKITNNEIAGGSDRDGIDLIGSNSDYTITNNRINDFDNGIEELDAVVSPTRARARRPLLDPVDGGTIDQNAFLGNQQGIVLEQTSSAPVVAQYNTFLDGGTDLNNNSAAAVDATDNYWGCDTGPNTSGCGTTANTGTGSIDSDPWVVLSAGVGQSTLAKGTSTVLTADLNHDSDGNTIAEHLYDSGPSIGVSAAFTQGTATPLGYSNGTWTFTLHATTVGSGSAAAQVDGSQVSIPMTVTPAGSGSPLDWWSMTPAPSRATPAPTG